MKTDVDMSNISVVDSELIDYEYEQQKINAEEAKKLKKFWFRLIIWLAFILLLAMAVIRLFIQFASFTRKYS